MIDAVGKYGTSMCGTPIATGYTVLFRRVEHKLSEFIGLESSMVFPSCYQANSGLFGSIAGAKDLIIVDHYAHASLIQGIKSAGCKVKPFLHNDVRHLEKVLRSSAGHENIFVVTESVFSTEGSIAPFDKIVELCYRYNAIPVVDDSHGIGVIGKTGKGILEHKKIRDYKGIYTSSLGKALANIGGMVSGKKELIEYLKYSCPGYIYSTAVTPAALAGIDKTLDILNLEFDSLSKRMWQHKKVISGCLEKSSFMLTQSETPISSIMGGNTERTIKIARLLYEHGIVSTPFIPPSVPVNEGKIRLIAPANLSGPTVKTIYEIFSDIKSRVPRQ
jgi:7-keto-8-aminopelargonate synthetase-like enzyme